MNNISIRLFHDFIENEFNFKIEGSVNNFLEIVPFVAENKNILDILFNILKNEDRVPLFVVFESFMEDIEYYAKTFIKNNINFQSFYEQGGEIKFINKEHYSLNNRISPYFQLEINNTEDLKKVLPLIYNIAEANLFVGFWATDNFYLQVKNDWPIIKVTESPFISFSPDAEGIYIFSNSANWTDLLLIKKKLSEIFGANFPEVIEWEYDGASFKEKE